MILTWIPKMILVLMMMVVTMIDRGGGGHWAALERRADEAIRAVWALHVTQPHVTLKVQETSPSSYLQNIGIIINSILRVIIVNLKWFRLAWSDKGVAVKKSLSIFKSHTKSPRNIAPLPLTKHTHHHHHHHHTWSPLERESLLLTQPNSPIHLIQLIFTIILFNFT